MTGREWDDYVEWSGLDEGPLDEIMRGRDRDRDRDRGRDRGSGAGPDPVARSRWFPRRCRVSAAAGARHRGAGEQRDS